MTSVDRITFQQTFPTGNYANVKLGIEMSLVPGVDDVQEAFAEASKIVNDAFEKLNPHIVWNESATQSPPKIIDRKAIDELEIAIDNATSVGELKLLFDRVLAVGNPEVGALYNKKLKELQP